MLLHQQNPPWHFSFPSSPKQMIKKEKGQITADLFTLFHPWSFFLQQSIRRNT
jgi:hypothetical protein